jgi:hypothetical protein
MASRLNLRGLLFLRNFGKVLEENSTNSIQYPTLMNLKFHREIAWRGLLEIARDSAVFELTISIESVSSGRILDPMT